MIVRLNKVIVSAAFGSCWSFEVGWIAAGLRLRTFAGEGYSEYYIPDDIAAVSVRVDAEVLVARPIVT